ncbi:MAG: DUF4147 domain-containing protein [Pseudomonadota bacterium]
MDENLLELWWTGVEAVRGDVCVRRALQQSPYPAPDQIIAVGKAASAMARAACAHWPGVPTLIVTKYDHAADAPAGARVIEAAHPVPDAQSIAAGAALRTAVANCGAHTHLLMLVSGGASALAEALPKGDSLDRLQADTQTLLASGANIAELNTFRRERSLIKGGKLLSGFSGARVTTLALSDVEGDSLGVIGSGIGDAPSDAQYVFEARIVASNAIARQAIVNATQNKVMVNEETLYDDVMTLALQIGQSLRDGAPGLYIFGGEPVVQLPANPGLGGRNMALAALIAREIAGLGGVEVLVAGTDGTDGPTDAAGAQVDGQTWHHSAEEALARADIYPWLKSNGALLVTGPTGTNVMDVVIAQKR